MTRRDHHDLIGGVLMTAIGVFIALYAQRYDFGSAARMGPGYWPALLACATPR